MSKCSNMSDARSTFAASLRQWRYQRGLSQEQLAERADLHRTYISDIERGARNVSLESIEKLARALEVSLPTLFSPPGPQVGDNGSPPAPPARFVDILLVEDNADDVELTLKAFTRSRVANSIRVARDGAEALDIFFGKEALADRLSDARQQIVLLDLNLPKVNGMEVLRQLKADRRTRAIPVIVLTVADGDREMLECRRLGAQAFITKPVNLQGLSRVTPELSLFWALINPVPAESTAATPEKTD